MRIVKNIVGILALGFGGVLITSGSVVTDIQITLLAVVILGGINLVG